MEKSQVKSPRFVLRTVVSLSIVAILASFLIISCGSDTPTNSTPTAASEFHQLGALSTTTTWEKVWGAPTGEIFLMGEEGLVYRKNGATWDSLNSGPAFDRVIHSVWGERGDNLYFVGQIIDRDTTYFDSLVDSNVTVQAPDKPFIKQYNGINFVDANIGTIDWGLYDIWGSADSNIYAVGFDGTVVHYDGMDWTHLLIGGNTPAHLNGVWGSSDSNIFVCGSVGAFLHYRRPVSPDTAWWKVVRSQTQYDLWDIWGLSNDTVYMVGTNGTIIRYNPNKPADSAMTRMETGISNALYSIWGTAENNIYAVGWGGKILHYDSTVWKLEPHLTNFGFLSVWGTSPTDIYAAGDIVVHYDGNEWTPVRVRNEPDFVDVWAGTESSYKEAILVGSGGRIMRSNGGDVLASMTVNGATTTTNFRGVGGFLDTALFMVGDGGAMVIRDDANLANWIDVSSGVSADLKAVSVLSRNVAWAVGAAGTMLKWDGSAWSTEASLTSETLNDVYVLKTSADTLACVVGNAGEAYWYDGTWHSPARGTTEDITSVTGTSSGDFWAVTGGGRLLRLSGGVWSTVSTDFGGTPLTSIWTDDAGTLTICGEKGSTYQYSLHTGVVTALDSSIGINLRGVYGFSAANFFVVGDYNHILHYRP